MADRKTRRITFRVEPLHFEWFKAAAEARGVKVSEWCRQVLDEAAVREDIGEHLRRSTDRGKA